MRSTFDNFASEVQDVFGTLDVLSRVVNDDLMEVEHLILDDPNVDIEAEKERIKAKVATKIQGVLSEFGLK